MTAAVDWSRWSVVLLKPDCLTRGLAAPVLARISQHLTVVDQRTAIATEGQIFAHYDDLLTTRLADFTWVDVRAALRFIYVGFRVGIALAYGQDAAPRLRDLIGHFDPSRARPDTIRGRFGIDSLQRATAAGRLIANLIHTSDDPAGAEREFGIWYGLDQQYLLHPPIDVEGTADDHLAAR